jgi:hypothetical protein
MPRVGFESTIPAFKRAKTVHASDHSFTVTGKCVELYNLNLIIDKAYAMFKCT